MIKPIIMTPLATILCLVCCGCPGGDAEDTRTGKQYGTAEILSLTEDAGGESVISLKWTGISGGVREEPVENIKISAIKGLPSDMEPKVGDKLPLAVEIEWVGKLSTGPREAWDKVDKREIRYLPDGLPE